MNREEMAQELLKREAAKPGSFSPGALAKARETIAPGLTTLPEQTITPGPDFDKRGLFDRLFNTGVSFDQAGSDANKAIAAAPDQSGTSTGKAVGAGFSGLDAFANSALLGIPKRLGLTGPQSPEQQRLFDEHPTAQTVGDVAGYMSKANPANLLASSLGGLAKRAVPSLAGGVLGRVAVGAGEAGVAAGVGSGGRTAIEGGTPEETMGSAATGAGIGAALGGGLGLLAEGAGGARRGIRSLMPELGKAEAGGAKLNPLRPSGINAGPEMTAIRGEARAAGAASPVDYQASKLVSPLTESGNAELKTASQQVAQEVERYAASPEGQKLRPMDRLLSSYTKLHQENIASESGAPLAEAELGGLKKSIGNLADAKLALKSQSDALMQPGAMRLSYDEATRRGFDVSKASQDMTNPEMARFMDVIVTPRRYNAQELLQNITNLEAQVERSPTDRILRQQLKAAMEQRDAFPGLSELRKSHEELLGGVKHEMGLAQEPTKGSFATANDEKALFNNIANYGNEGRYSPIDEALRAQAGKAGQGRNLELVQALKALKSLEGESVIPLGVGSSGRFGFRVPAKAAAMRADPILQLLMQGAQPAASAGGQAAGRRRRSIDEFDLGR
jgi:hypothetical protein